MIQSPSLVQLTPKNTHSHSKKQQPRSATTTTTNSKTTNTTTKSNNNDPKTPPNQSNNNNNNNNSDKKSGSKVSHVICKFYKAGNCSAGTSCQFSHNLPEVGQGKPVCQWFVKGNCRFAHKCALAHILPGQPMAMDRKNKRAAQAAAREAAAASASGQTDPPFPTSPPPELTLELVPDHHQFPTKIVIDEPTSSLDSLSSPEVLHRSSRQQRLGSPRALLGDIDIETSNQSDDLQFGLPDDFTASEHSPVHFGSTLSPSALHSGFPSPYVTHHHLHTDPYNNNNHQNHRSARLSPISQHNGISSDYHHQTPTSVERTRHWPRDQSPTPFGTGSPFSAPGSRSVFLPRIGSFGSDDGYPRSAPSIATSPRHVSHMMGVHHPNGDDPGLEVDGEEDVTELLPSSLHSLLTPAERHRQNIRKHAPHTLYSRSVPMEDMIGGKVKKQMEPSALRNGMALDQHSLAVSTEPGFTNQFTNKKDQPHSSLQQQEAQNGAVRPQPTTYLSSSYIPPPTPFGTWEYSQAHDQGGSPSRKLPTPIALMQQKELSVNGGAFGHAPGTSLPQGLAAGLSRLHFQPPLPTGLTPCGSPSGGMNLREQPLSPPRSPPPSIHHKLIVPPITSPFSQRMAGLNLGSTTVNYSSPLSRNVSCSPAFNHQNHLIPDDDDTPFRLEM